MPWGGWRTKNKNHKEMGFYSCLPRGKNGFRFVRPSGEDQLSAIQHSGIQETRDTGWNENRNAN